jgi:uncharacterized protein YecE (DUF72 family)
MGGWNYEPWRKTFYPKDVSKNQELHYASRQVTAIEVNGTFYRLQSPAVFAKWREETPDGFVFSLKAPRFLVNRRDLRTMAEGLPKFINSGLSQLQTKLGPLLWQLAPTKPFDAAEVDGFLGMLPREVDGIPLRHAFEVRHESFMTPEYLQIAREHRVATVFADTDEHPSFADATADFIYARLMRTVSAEPTGYTKSALATWAKRAGQWAFGEDASSLPRVQQIVRKDGARDVFMFFISGAKERAPAAAQHLLTLVDNQGAKSD